MAAAAAVRDACACVYLGLSQIGEQVNLRVPDTWNKNHDPVMEFIRLPVQGVDNPSTACQSRGE